MTTLEKMKILTDSAQYDLCDYVSHNKSSQVNLPGIYEATGHNGCKVPLFKTLLTNKCKNDCKYCINRKSNDVPRASFTPDEICELTIQFYRRNYIEGLFLSSGILYSPTYTMELIYEAIYKLRTLYRFQGYIHVKAIPGADPEIIRRLGLLADRMSVNLELPTAEGLQRLAPNKHRKNILAPMRMIQQGITQNKNELMVYRHASSFVPAGQSTQMIVGATPENDYQIMMVAENLYKKFDLKRVYYSAFVSVNEDKELPALPGGPPLLREHRLYQADWLLRFYGFEAKELLSEDKPNFNVLLDPKADWALRHLEQFPVEINRADYQTILRVPGIGVKSAQRIVRARKNGNLSFEDLKKIGVTLKRALYFITCNGRMMYPTKLEEDYITRNLISNKEKLPFDRDGMTYRQLSLFDDSQELMWKQAVGG